MAILSTAVWELRADGSDANGGGYDAGIASAGTDYSQQTAAQLSLTDLAMTAGGTTLTSATGGFTSAMIGNAIYIASGTNFVAGWYFITARADTNTVTIDRDATNASNATSGTGAVGGARVTITDAFGEALIGGNTVWVRNAGTITQGANVSIASTSATVAAPISIVGYNSTRDDKPKETDRPTMAIGANLFSILVTGWVLKNIIFTTTSATGIVGPNNGVMTILNCKCTNTSATADRAAFSVRGCQFYQCEAVSTNGRAFYSTNLAFNMVGCYAHNSVDGLYTATALGGNIINCVFDTCSSNGIVAQNKMSIVNCTIYNCGVGIATSAYDMILIINNIIHSCTTGVSASSLNTSQIMDNNVFYNNNTNTSNMVAMGEYDLKTDPKLNDPANGDFTLQSGSSAIDTGMEALNNVGLTGTY